MLIEVHLSRRRVRGGMAGLVMIGWRHHTSLFHPISEFFADWLICWSQSAGFGNLSNGDYSNGKVDEMQALKGVLADFN